ncbi:MAG: hypothetical protein LIP10_07325 [Clostridiales bacterium]|nr:hypothetical protein [Clostridiales bacterium]
MSNALSRDLANVGIKVQYDTQCKRVLSNKIILAWILKYTTDEYKDCTLEDICSYINGTPKIGTVPVSPGETNASNPQNTERSERVIGMANEDKVPGEGAIYYDLIFSAQLPPSSSRMVKHVRKTGKKTSSISIAKNSESSQAHVPDIIFADIEPQKSFYPGYHIETRGIYNCARMISAQLSTVFEDSNYDEIKKSLCIFICMNAPKKIGNSIIRYSLTPVRVYGNYPERSYAYDKLSAIVVTLNEDMATENIFLQMMNTLLSKTKTYIEKRRELETRFHIPMDREPFGKELEIMCNLSDLVEEQGIRKGVRKGIRIGIKQERQRTNAAEQRAILAEHEVERLKKELALSRAQ